MRILLLHNRYQIRGGEEVVLESEKTLLEDRGHSVALLETTNDEIKGLVAKAKTAVNTIYCYSSKQRVRREIDSFKPDVVHVHNFFPRLSPSVYDACQEAGVPVVQTLHNYRLLCPKASFFRSGQVCEDCLGKLIPWPGVLHGCYRDSRLGTGVVAAMLTYHRIRKTWTEGVNVYIALTEFAKQKFIEGGLPADKITVKPNFVYPDPNIGEGRGNYALFVGRLSPEKGLETLLNAWALLEKRIPLKIVGEGSMADAVAAATEKLTEVEWLGRQPHEQVLSLMKNAMMLIFPSVWYEGFPVTIAEAYAVGLPVVASKMGGMSSIIDSGRTGLLFQPGDAEELARKVEWALQHPEELNKMRREARAEFEAKYSAEENYRQLMEIYSLAVGDRSLN